MTSQRASNVVRHLQWTISKNIQWSSKGSGGSDGKQKTKNGKQASAPTNKKSKATKRLKTIKEKQSVDLQNMSERDIQIELYKTAHLLKRLLLKLHEDRSQERPVGADALADTKYNRLLGQAAKSVFLEYLADADRVGQVYIKGTSFVRDTVAKVLEVAEGLRPVNSSVRLDKATQRTLAGDKLHNRRSRAKSALAAFISQRS